MKKIFKYPLLLLFSVLIIVVGIADMFVSHREFSEMENRQLAQKPPLKWESLISLDQKNKFSNLYETYVNDQFIGRDGWITAKSICESALGKIENNGIVYGKEKHLFEKYPVTDDWRINKNIAFFSDFINKYYDKTQITVALVPNSYAIYPELLPLGLHNVNQRDYIKNIYSQLPQNVAKLDLFPVMDILKDSYIYYRTDHHWTTTGAYGAYAAFVKSRGLQAVSQETLISLARIAQDFYGTYYNKCKLFSADADTITWYDIPFTSITIDGNEKTAMNDDSKWTAHDKYAAFLWGNNGTTIIKSNNNINHKEGQTSRVLLIKDSYGNSLAPFLTYSYDEVYIVDPRFIDKLSTIMNVTKFDDVLLLYNFMNFSSDSNIPRITY